MKQNSAPAFSFFVLLIVFLGGYGYFVYAAAPLGGYTAGQTLDPDCAPGDTDCIVALSSGGLTTADNGLTSTGGNVQLGGLLIQDTVIDQDGNDFSIMNGDVGYQSSSDILGLGQPGVGMTYNDGSVSSMVGLLGNMVPIMSLQADFGSNHISRVITLGEPGGMEIGVSTNTRKTNFSIDSGSAVLSAIDTNASQNSNIEISYNNGVEFSFDGNSSSYIFPRNDGSANQVLTTNGNGQLSWQTPSGGGGSSPFTIENTNSIFSTGLTDTGLNSTAAYSFFVGERAGSDATSAQYSNFLGRGAGLDAINAETSNFFGLIAGRDAINAYSSNFLGNAAGNAATGADNANFFGTRAGSGASSAPRSNFIGFEAGQNATSAHRSNFFGYNAGTSATNANNSNFFGENAGNIATNAANSTFIGNFSGYSAINASNSFFVGANAGAATLGLGTQNAANSIFLGTNAGYFNADGGLDNTTDPDDFSILLGNYTSTGGFENSIALGQRATNTASNQFMIGSATRPITSMVLTGDYSGGSCTFAVGGMSCSSDERLKTNIEDLQGSTLDTILNIRTVNYNWNSSSDSPKQVGFIAQDLQQYFPELVSVGQGGYLQVNYAQMTPILVEAIREMNLKIIEINDIGTPNTWRDSLIAWFGNTANGITKIYADVFESKQVQTDQLCIKDVCMDRDQLYNLMNQTGPAGNSTPPTPDPVVIPDIVSENPPVIDPIPEPAPDPVVEPEIGSSDPIPTE